MIDDSQRGDDPGDSDIDRVSSGVETKEPVAAVVVEPSGAIPQDAWNRAVGAWIDGYVRSSPVAQAPGAWEHLSNVMPRLKELLDRELAS